MDKLNLKSDKDTHHLASNLAKELLSSSKKSKATVIGLVGELGVGKTTFTQAFAKAMGIRKRILSPTFLIMKRFSLPKSTNFESLLSSFSKCSFK